MQNKQSRSVFGRFTQFTIAAIGMVALSATSASAANILPTGWDIISTFGVVGTLRAGSPWGGGASLGAQSSIVDGLFLAESTQWNSGSWWWDEDPSINANPVVTTIHLNQFFTIGSFTVQADNNDTYRLEYWTGSAWQVAWDVAAVAGVGLTTRSSGELAAFTTNFLRFTATGGDNYYSVSEIQAFTAVPEPASLVLLGSGLLAAGVARRRMKRNGTR